MPTFNTVKQYSIQHPLRVIYLIAIAVLTLYNLTPPLQAFDTSFYLLAAENILEGRLDCLRTPVYPLFLKLCSLPCGGAALNALVCIVQSAVYLISIRCLYQMLCQLVRRHWIVVLTTCLYVLLPAASWCNELTTESFSISLSVIISYWIVCFLNNPSWQRALAIAVLLLFMVMLRTNFIALFAILPCIWLWMWTRTKVPTFAVAITFLLIPIGTYLGYCQVFKQQYGIFAASIATTSCDYYNLRRSLAWDTNKLSDKRQIAACKYIEEKEDPSYATLYQYIDNTNDAATIAQAFRQMKNLSEKEFAEYKIQIFSESLSSQMASATNTHTPLAAILFFATKLLSMPLSTLYLFILLTGIILLIYCIKRNRFTTLDIIFLWCSVSAQCIGIPLTGSDSFNRLLLPIYPIVLCLMACMADRFLWWHRCKSRLDALL